MHICILKKNPVELGTTYFHFRYCMFSPFFLHKNINSDIDKYLLYKSNKHHECCWYYIVYVSNIVQFRKQIYNQCEKNNLMPFLQYIQDAHISYFSSCNSLCQQHMCVRNEMVFCGSLSMCFFHSQTQTQLKNCLHFNLFSCQRKKLSILPILLSLKRKWWK